ncbi:MAG TPA: cation transporter [Planctomycetes bacterium]|nr:cation transporter [Planctomycetota bacterium]
MAHHHNHQVKSYNRAFAIGIGLNIAFVLVELAYGLAADSLALIADAGHNFSDVLSLVLAWGASYLATKAATDKRTYGYRKVTILASLANAILLLLALGAIAWEALHRLWNPQLVEGMTVILVAGIGVVINTLTALLFLSGQKHDLNIRGAFLHMAADAAISLGVALGGALILWTGWVLIDPILSLAIVLIILLATWSLLRESMDLAMDSVPQGTDLAGIRAYLKNLPGVAQLHDLHVWALSTSEVALSAHLVVRDGTDCPKLLQDAQKQLHDAFGIEHATIQLEPEDAVDCPLNP